MTMDEMAITPSVELDMITGKLYSDVTLPGHTGVATHACVFMLAGNTTRWKQVVAVITLAILPMEQSTGQSLLI